jgi:hypothetical protein
VEPPTVLVVTESWNRLSGRAIKSALALAADVAAVHLVRLGGQEVPAGDETSREQWRVDVEEPVAAKGLQPPGLMFIPARIVSYINNYFL